MKKILLLAVFFIGGMFTTSKAGPNPPPGFSIIGTSCGTTHHVSPNLTNKQLADLLDHYEKTDCGG